MFERFFIIQNSIAFWAFDYILTISTFFAVSDIIFKIFLIFFEKAIDNQPNGWYNKDKK